MDHSAVRQSWRRQYCRLVSICLLSLKILPISSCLFLNSMISSKSVAGQMLATVSYTVTGLLPYTNYLFSVRAHNSIGLGPHSDNSSLIRTVEFSMYFVVHCMDGFHVPCSNHRCRHGHQHHCQLKRHDVNIVFIQYCSTHTSSRSDHTGLLNNIVSPLLIFVMSNFLLCCCSMLSRCTCPHLAHLRTRAFLAHAR